MLVSYMGRPRPGRLGRAGLSYRIQCLCQARDAGALARRRSPIAAWFQGQAQRFGSDVGRCKLALVQVRGPFSGEPVEENRMAKAHNALHLAVLCSINALVSGNPALAAFRGAAIEGRI